MEFKKIILDFAIRKLLLFKEKVWRVDDYAFLFISLSIIYYVSLKFIVNNYSEFFFVDDYPYSPVKEGITPFFRLIVLDYVKVIYSTSFMLIVLTVLFKFFEFKINFWKLLGAVSTLFFIAFGLTELAIYLEINMLVLFIRNCLYNGYGGQVSVLVALILMLLVPFISVLYIKFSGRFLVRNLKRGMVFLFVTISFNLLNNGVGKFAESKIIPFKEKRMEKYIRQNNNLDSFRRNDFKGCVRENEYLEMVKKRMIVSNRACAHKGLVDLFSDQYCIEY
ncbi:hypothetical protein [Halobacteriovorax sp. RZ-2]|uniref:hypothetical protein n=1 Tax=unclassified Halobacteriovorax TaxID=2639665 RepID=UPI00371BC5AA